MERGNPASAIDVLQYLQEQYPASVAANRASFLLGRSYKRLLDPRGVDAFKQVLVDLPEMGDYALMELGEWAYSRKEFITAAKEYRAVSITYPDSLMTARALYRAASAYLQSGKWAQARESLEDFEARYPGSSRIPEIKRMLAESWIGLGKPDQAASILRRLWIDYPSDPTARAARELIERLRSSGHPIPLLTLAERLEQTQNLYEAASYRDAITGWESLLKRGLSSSSAANIRLKIGMARIKLREYDAAKKILSPLAARGQSASIRSGALGQLAEVYFRAGDEKGLSDIVEVLGELAPASTRAARANYLLGHIIEEQKRFGEAAQVFRRVVDQSPGDVLADDSLWHVGWCRYLGQEYSEAARIFAGLSAAYPKSPMAVQALYWRARSLENAGLTDESTRAYQELCSRYRLMFYCQRAAQRVKIPGLPPPPLFKNPLMDKKAAAYEGDFHFRRAVVLRELRMKDEAASEIDATLSRFAGDPDILAELNGMLYELGDYRRSLRNIKLRYADILNQGDDRKPLSFWIQSYPMGWMDLIRSATPPGGAELALVAAVIREESAYDPRAVSSVGAIGLMQLMPDTGRWVARRIGLDLPGKDALYNPETNIRLGASYLSFLLEQFEGNFVYAIAAYNAGSGAVDRWITSFGSRDQDEFIESIPYRETRNFVKRVLRSLGEYRRISSLMNNALIS